MMGPVDGSGCVPVTEASWNLKSTAGPSWMKRRMQMVQSLSPRKRYVVEYSIVSSRVEYIEYTVYNKFKRSFTTLV